MSNKYRTADEILTDLCLKMMSTAKRAESAGAIVGSSSWIGELLELATDAATEAAETRKAAAANKRDQSDIAKAHALLVFVMKRSRTAESAGQELASIASKARQRNVARHLVSFGPMLAISRFPGATRTARKIVEAAGLDYDAICENR